MTDTPRPSSKATEVYFLDLIDKRERTESRRTAAEALGIHPQHLYNLEKRRSGGSLAVAIRAVRRYGPLRLVSAQDGAVFLLQELPDEKVTDVIDEAGKETSTRPGATGTDAAMDVVERARLRRRDRDERRHPDWWERAHP